MTRQPNVSMFFSFLFTCTRYIRTRTSFFSGVFGVFDPNFAWSKIKKDQSNLVSPAAKLFMKNNLAEFSSTGNSQKPRRKKRDFAEGVCFPLQDFQRAQYNVPVLWQAFSLTAPCGGRPATVNTPEYLLRYVEQSKCHGRPPLLDATMPTRFFASNAWASFYGQITNYTDFTIKSSKAYTTRPPQIIWTTMVAMIAHERRAAQQTKNYRSILVDVVTCTRISLDFSVGWSGVFVIERPEGGILRVCGWNQIVWLPWVEEAGAISSRHVREWFCHVMTFLSKQLPGITHCTENYGNCDGHAAAATAPSCTGDQIKVCFYYQPGTYIRKKDTVAVAKTSDSW